MDFKIARGHRECSVCDRAFEEGERYNVGLTPGDDDGTFVRSDVCAQCWERQGSGGFTAHWPAEFSTSKKPALLDPDMLWQVFHRANTGEGAGEVEPEMLPKFAYVAALGLMRLKKMKLKETKRTKAGEILVFETPGKRAKDRVLYEVLNPGLDEDGVTLVQDRLADLA